MKVSVLVPTYNRAEFLPDCIKSILNQRFKYFEIVVVDDGSTDSTADLMDFYVKKYPNIKYVQIKHSGAAMARNEGIKHCEGEYIALCDSDDFFYAPTKLSMQVKALDKGLDVHYTGYWYANEKGKILVDVPATQTPTKENLKEGQALVHGTLMAKRKCFTDHPYRDMPYNEDLALTVDWVKAGYKFGFNKKPYTVVRIHQGTLTIANNKGLSYKEQLDKMPELKAEIEAL